MPERLNCWQLKKCGREPGGTKAAESGVCPSATAHAFDGVNSGTNGGRICWFVAGTFCGGEVQGTFAQKIDTCKSCEVYHRIRREEGDACTLSVSTAGRTSAPTDAEPTSQPTLKPFGQTADRYGR